MLAASAEEAITGADVVVTATASRTPILRGSWLRPGQHVTAVGADDPAKAELDPSCFTRADLLVADSRRDAPRFAGDLARAIGAGAVTGAAIDAEIGELVLERHPGRRHPAEITVAELVGLGVQDLAAAETALSRLRHRRRAGQTDITGTRRLPASVLDLRRAAREGCL